MPSTNHHIHAAASRDPRRRPASVNVSRRRALQLFGSAGAAAAMGPLLAACGRDEPDDESGGSPSPAGGELSGEVSIAIPEATAADVDFYTEQFKKFEAETGVTVNFLHYPDPQFEESIQGLFRAGDQPDVYRMVKPTAMMYPSWSNDWIQPLDKYSAITDLLESEYGETALDTATSGLHIGGELYGVPGVTNADWAGLRPLMVNMDLLNQYGIDSPPDTWSELRDAAAKVTTDSGGDAYGYALFGSEGLLSDINIRPMVECAGPVRGLGYLTSLPFDYQTGKAAASHQSVVDAVALVRGMVEDGSIVAGWQNLDAQGFWQAWAAGQVAMSPFAGWWSEEILKINNQVNVTPVVFPVPDDGRKGFQATESSWAATWGMTKASKNPEAAAALIAMLGSLDVQRQYYDVSKVPSALADEYADDLTETASSIIGLAPDAKRQGPNPTVRSLDARGVIAAVQAKVPSPDYNAILFTATDKGDNYADLAATFDDELNKVISDAITQAMSDGAELDESIFTFEDWDPMADYTTSP